MIRKIFGLDIFDVIVQVVVTGFAAGMVGTISRGPDGDPLIMAIFASSILVLAYRRKRALRNPENVEPPSDRMLELEERVAELEHSQQRVLELEERLDFAERLLAKSHDRELLK